MLVHLKRVGRRYAALTWAIVLAFAFSPALCMANAVGAGVFTRFLIHAHDKDEEGHVHHAHFDHGHDHHALESTIRTLERISKALLASTASTCTLTFAARAY